MNPTSPSRSSPSPLPSTSAEPQSIEHVAAQEHASCIWKMSQDAYFPVYPPQTNLQFRERINELLKHLEVNLQNTMACLSKISSSPLKSNVETVCTLVAFLGYTFPTTVPLPLLTSPTALAAIRPLSSSLNPEDHARASEELFIAMNDLASISTQIIECMSHGIQMQSITAMNAHSINRQRAFMSAISRRLFHNRPLSAPESTSLPEITKLCDEDESCRSGHTSQELLVCMISAINPFGDGKCQRLKSDLLAEASMEAAKAKEFLVSQACHYFLRNSLAIPTTGDSLLAACNQHCAMNLLIPNPLIDLKSWDNLIFCCLSRIFLRDKQVLIPSDSDARWFVTAIRPYLDLHAGVLKSIWPSGALKCALIQALQSNPQEGEATTSSATAQSTAACLNLNVGFSRFLRSATILNSLLRILFKTETNNDLSPATIESFQRYTGRRIVENSDFTEAQKEAILASSAMCIEHSSEFRPTA